MAASRTHPDQGPNPQPRLGEKFFTLEKKLKETGKTVRIWPAEVQSISGELEQGCLLYVIQGKADLQMGSIKNFKCS